MRDKFINSKSCRNRKLRVNVQQNIEKIWFLAAIFCFPNLKVKDTKDRMSSDRFELNTPNYVKTSEKKLDSNVEQCSKFHIPAH